MDYRLERMRWEGGGARITNARAGTETKKKEEMQIWKMKKRRPPLYIWDKTRSRGTILLKNYKFDYRMCHVDVKF